MWWSVVACNARRRPKKAEEALGRSARKRREESNKKPAIDRILKKKALARPSPQPLTLSIYRYLSVSFYTPLDRTSGEARRAHAGALEGTLAALEALPPLSHRGLEGLSSGGGPMVRV